MANERIVEYKEPQIIDEVALDCEPHQAIRKNYCFLVGEGDSDQTGYCANVVAKMCEEDGVHVAYAYIDNGGDMNPNQAEGVSYGSTDDGRFLPMSERMTAAVINTAKVMVVEDFEKMRKKETEYENV